MACRFTELIIDCEDPRRLGDFWAEVLGYRETDAGSRASTTTSSWRGRPALARRCSCCERPTRRSRRTACTSTSTPPTATRTPRSSASMALGAKRVDIGQGEQTWVVLADPEGNEFCVLRSRVDPHGLRRPLAGAGRRLVGPWRASWSSAPGSAGLAAAARLADARPPGDGLRAGRRRSAARLGACTRGRVHASTPGPSLLTLPAVYRDLFIKTGAAARGVARPRRRSTRPATTASPTAPSSTCPTRPAPGIAARLRRRARRRRRRRLGPPARRGPRRSGRSRAGPSSSQPLAGTARPRCAWPAAPRDLRTVAPWQHACAASARTTCATRTSACCSTATRPTPAPTRGGRRRRWRPSRTSSRPSAPGTCAAGCAGSALAVHDRAVERGAVVRTGARRRRDPRRGRPGGRCPAAVGRAARRPTSSSPNADAARLYADLLPASRRSAARRRLRPGHAVAVRLRAAARAARPDARARAPHGAVPARLRRRVRRRLRHGRAARPSTDPTVYVSAPDDPALRPDDDSRGLVRARQRAPARRRSLVRSTGRRPGSPTRTPTACSPCWPSAAWTCATGCCGARSARPPTSSADARARRRDLRHLVQRRPRRVPAPGEPLAGARACSSSAARRTPAAGCRWSGCRPRSSPELIGPA